MTLCGVGVMVKLHVAADPLQAPDQEKPGGSVPVDDVAVNMTNVEFML